MDCLLWVFRANQDNYRGITLLPLLCKMYEKCLTIRIENWVKRKNIISNVQGAGKENCSSLPTAWVVREIIIENIEYNNPVYLALLDTKKAFDTVWQDGLFFKLDEIGIKGKMWRILRLLYDNFMCKVCAAGNTSDGFVTAQGIHQGAPCSMLFYAIFINNLLCELQDFWPGIKIGNHIINCVAFVMELQLVVH